MFLTPEKGQIVYCAFATLICLSFDNIFEKLTGSIRIRSQLSKSELLLLQRPWDEKAQKEQNGFFSAVQMSVSTGEEQVDVDDFIMNNTNVTLNDTFTDDLQFNDRLLLNVVGYSLLFVVGTIGNTAVSILSYKQNVSPENKGRTNVHMMVLHLTLADLIVSFIVIPLEIGWRLSVQVLIQFSESLK